MSTNFDLAVNNNNNKKTYPKSKFSNKKYKEKKYRVLVHKTCS